MSRRLYVQNQILVVVLALQIVLVAVVFWPRPASSVAGGESLFVELEADQIVRLTISGPDGNQIRLAKSPDVWVLPEADDYIAQGSKINEFLGRIVELKADHHRGRKRGGAGPGTAGPSRGDQSRNSRSGKSHRTCAPSGFPAPRNQTGRDRSRDQACPKTCSPTRPSGSECHRGLDSGRLIHQSLPGARSSPGFGGSGARLEDHHSSLERENLLPRADWTLSEQARGGKVSRVGQGGQGV